MRRIGTSGQRTESSEDKVLLVRSLHLVSLLLDGPCCQYLTLFVSHRVAKERLLDASSLL